MKFGNFSIAREMESRIGVGALRAIGGAAEEIGVEPYLVGGLTRDVVAGTLGRGSPDVDIALVGIGSDGFDEIARRVGGKIVKRSQFGTVAMRVGARDFDLVMARSESYPLPGSLPVARPGTLEEDLARRDFSVNAMAVSLSGNDWGGLRDPHNGLKDLKDGVLRALYPGSFRDDATRVLRASRYASRLSLRLFPETKRDLLESVEYIGRISPARIRNELERVFLEGHVFSALGLLWEWGAMTAIHPALKYDARAWNLFGERTDSLTDRERIAVAYAIFGRGVSKSESDAIVSRLEPGSAGRRALEESSSLGRMVSDGELAGLSNSDLSLILDPLSESGVIGCSLAMATDPAAGPLEEYLGRLKGVKSELSGNDIMVLGVERGPEVGRALRRLRAARQDGLLESRAEEEAFILSGMKASRGF